MQEFSRIVLKQCIETLAYI